MHRLFMVLDVPHTVSVDRRNNLDTCVLVLVSYVFSLMYSVNEMQIERSGLEFIDGCTKDSVLYTGPA